MTVVPKSNYLANKILDGMNGGTDYTQPATTYFALLTVTCTPAGGGTEVTGGSYARIAVTNNSTNWPAASSQQKTNGTLLDWGTATANWGTVVVIAEYDASSGGNLLKYGLLTTAITVNSGQPFSVATGNAVFTES
jgi:hypothetical protein